MSASTVLLHEGVDIINFICRNGRCCEVRESLTRMLLQSLQRTCPITAGLVSN